MLCIKHSEVVRHRLTVKLSLLLLRRRRNFTHEVNFTIADNFTCPKGKLSFSVFSVKDNTLTALGFFERLLPSEVKCASRVRCAFGTMIGTHHCDRREQHHYAKHNITLAKPKLH